LRLVRIRVIREPSPSEHRVALSPRGARTLVAAGHEVDVMAGAGVAAGFPDDRYEEAGAHVIGEPTEVDLVLAVGPVTVDDVGSTKAVLSFLDPLGSPAEMARFAEAGITALAMELVPRTTLAQSMDALSSQATAAGYEAVLLAASALPRFMPMLMTAAGTIPPARALVLGAGVAGLQAIATARRLGAIVSGYDIRPAAREQVESLGAKFVGGPVAEAAETAGGYAGEVDEETRRQQQEALADAVAESDIVITTAQVPGRAAPRLVSRDMVDRMKPGSVIIDLAASTGGNCELTVADETVVHGGVSILGPTDLTSRKSGDASDMYSRNLVALLEYLTDDDGALAIDPEDEIAAGVCVTRDGEVASARVRDLLGGGR
jgi:NAD(P) transhydrogenase subunit alpha